MRTTHYLAFIPLAMVLACLPGCGDKAQSEPVAAKAIADATPVEVATIVRGDMDARYAGTAVLEAEHEAKIVTEASGVVLDILVEEGARVKRGQVLARLDAEKSRLQVRQAEGEVQRLKNDVSRNEHLNERQLIGRQVLEQSQFDYATRKAEVDLAKVVLRKSEIIAPFDGVITHRSIKEGQMLNVYDEAFQIADFRDLKAKMHVPERDAAAIKAGQKVVFTVDAFPQRSYAAKVERVAPVVEGTTGTVTVTIAITGEDAYLRPGLFTRMSVVYEHIVDTALLPKAAVMTEQGQSSVFVIENGKAYQHKISLGHESENLVQVLSGLSSGASVVVAGQSALTEGANVEVVTGAAEKVVASNGTQG